MQFIKSRCAVISGGGLLNNPAFFIIDIIYDNDINGIGDGFYLVLAVIAV